MDNSNTRPLLETIVHNQVVLSSANSYSAYRNQGLEITTNLGSQRNRWVGGVDNQLYPDIIVWKPNYIGSTGGTALIIEQIETPGTVYGNADFWRKLGETGIAFTLVIPSGTETSVKQIINQQAIRVNKLQTYQFNQAQNTYTFQNHNLP